MLEKLQIVSCDKMARLQLFPYHKYKTTLIKRKQKFGSTGKNFGKWLLMVKGQN